MYGLAVMLSISTRTTSKNINKIIGWWWKLFNNLLYNFRRIFLSVLDYYCLFVENTNIFHFL